MSIVILKGILKHETDHALLINFGGLSGRTWVPKSVIKVESIPDEFNISKFSIQEWFAIKEGLM